MGADAFIFIFDYSAYRTEVVPAFVNILNDGNTPPWVAEIHREYQGSIYGEFPPPDEPPLTGGVDFRTNCTHLDSEFASLLPTYLGSLYDSDWTHRSCRSDECPDRGQCPLVHRGGRASTAEAERLLGLLQIVIARRCLGTRQFLGRSIDVFWYWDLLDDLGVKSTDPIRNLLINLGRRGYVAGYKWCIGTDGIHGWLNPNEAAELAERLFALPLPDYNQSFATMVGFQQVKNVVENHPNLPPFYWPSYVHPGAPFKELSLSFVRTVCLLAGREHKGVLWGNDLYM
jgi:hypothetical protein